MHQSKQYIFQNIENFDSSDLPKIAAKDIDFKSAKENINATCTHKKNSASVAIIFVPSTKQKTQSRIIFTKRSQKVKTHKGQISLPGGFVDFDQDSTLVDTATREVYEEIGIPQIYLRYHCSLPPIESHLGVSVWPIFFTCSSFNFDEIKLNHDEVAEIYFIPWTMLTSKKMKWLNMEKMGIKFQSPVYETPSCTIWGLTAQIISSAHLI